jgi:hypothetical protein
VLEPAFAEDGLEGAAAAASVLAQRALDRTAGIARLALFLDRPVIGLGAGAAAYYPGAGDVLGAQAIIPDHADVANAVGAVVGQVRIVVTAEIVQPVEGRFEIAGLADAGHLAFADAEAAMETAEALCRTAAERRANEAGAAEATVSATRDLKTAMVEGREFFVAATVTAIAGGRPATAS